MIWRALIILFMDTGKMKENPTIDDIIEALDPDKIEKEVVEPHAKARATYGKNEDYGTQTSVKNRKEFKKAVISYMQHHHKEIYGTDLNETEAWNQGKGLLDAFEDVKGGHNAFYLQAKSDQKLQDVFNSLHNAMEQRHRGEYKTMIKDWVDPMDFEETAELARQFMEKYEKILPKGTKDKMDLRDPKELANQWEALIDTHLDTVYKKVKPTMKKYDPGKNS